jgi:hypothetical protein
VELPARAAAHVEEQEDDEDMEPDATAADDDLVLDKPFGDD